MIMVITMTRTVKIIIIIIIFFNNNIIAANHMGNGLDRNNYYTYNVKR